MESRGFISLSDRRCGVRLLEIAVVEAERTPHIHAHALRGHLVSPIRPFIFAGAHVLYALFQHIESKVGLLFGDDQWRTEAQRIGATAEE
jgi:hypothetical protein